MKQSKRLTALLLATLLTLNLSACQPRNKIPSEDTPSPLPPQETVTVEATAPPAQAVEPETKPLPTSFATAKEMQETFDAFILEEFIARLENDYFAIHQTLRHPEQYGIDLYQAEITLGDAINDESIAEIRAQNQAAQEMFSIFQCDLLTEEQQETYKLYEYLLNNALDSVKEEFVYMDGAFTPMQGLQNDIASFLMEFTFYEEYDVQAYLALMRDIPRYVEDNLAYTRKQAELGFFMSDASAKETMAYCKKIIDSGMDSALLHSVLYNIENCAFLGDVQIQRYTKEAREIFQTCILPAYQNIYDSISLLQNSQNNQMGLYWFENGREYYEYLFRLTTGSDRTIEEIRDLLQQYLNGAVEEVAVISTEHRAVYSSYFNERVHTDYQNFRQVLEDLEFFTSQDFPAIDAVDYTVNTLDPQVSVEGIGAYYIVPPLGDDRPQKIKVNPLQNLAANQFYTLQILAHEGFPGHLYQTNYVQQKLENPFRKSTSILGYSEGFATYAELYSMNYLLNLGLEDKDDFLFDENTVTLMQSYTLFENCLIALCDIGIHYDGWTKEETMEFMQQYLDVDYVDAVYNQLVGDPAGFLSYYVGCVEILELRRMAQEELGSHFNDVEFHEAILQGGDLPFSILRENVEAYIDIKK